jgi:hypothetical protein
MTLRLPKVSLNFARTVKKPVWILEQVSLVAGNLVQATLPVYVNRYDVTIQLLISKPFKSFVMATSAVPTTVLSRVERNRQRHKLPDIS